MVSSSSLKEEILFNYLLRELVLEIKTQYKKVLIEVMSNHKYIYMFSNMSKYIFLKIPLTIKKTVK